MAPSLRQELRQRIRGVLEMTGDPQLTNIELRVLNIVARISNAGAIAYANAIAAETGIPEGEIDLALKRLIELGHIADGDGGMN